MNPNSAASSYDLVPYESYPFEHLHPARLAATAQLRGYTAPPVSTARVLDLGCGSGGHAIGLACFYPNMQLIGVDLAAGQIERGMQRIRDLGLTNVSLHAGDLALGLPSSAIEAAEAFGGQFDYIVCQGVYYVVPDLVRDAIWQIFTKHLAPQGVAHISYNTYPGWKHREVAQDFAQFHAPSNAAMPGPLQVQTVRDGLSLVAQLAPQDNQGMAPGYGLSLKAEALAASQAVPGLLFHEFLSGDNRPLYFMQMVSQARAAGFEFLSEASLPHAWPGSVGQATQTLIDIAGGDPLRFEQYLDFANARTYRSSLWLSAQVSQRLVSPLEPWSAQGLQGLHIVADLTRGSGGVAGQQAFVAASGMPFSVSDEAATVLQQLVCQPNVPLWVEASALMRSHPEAVSVLHECVLLGLLAAWREPPQLCADLPALQAPDWLRRDASRADTPYLVSCQHRAVHLDAAARQLLAGLDEGHIHRELAAEPSQANLSQFHELGWIKLSA